MEIIILTQPNCPNCDKLKMFLKFGLKGKYDNYIKEISKLEEPQTFTKLTQELEITTTPAIITKGKVLKDSQPSKVKEFLEMWVKI